MSTRRTNQSFKPVQVILVISDLGEPSKLWTSALQQKGYTTIHETVEHAQQTCKVVAPDVIVIDIEMSHVRRLALCSKLRAISHEPIILLVSDCKGSEMVDIYNIGVNECLLKPISPAFLVVKVISWLLRKRWFAYHPE